MSLLPGYSIYIESAGTHYADLIDTTYTLLINNDDTANDVIDFINEQSEWTNLLVDLPSDSNGSAVFGNLDATEMVDNGMSIFNRFNFYVISGAVAKENVRSVYRASAKIVPTKSHREVRTGTGSAYQCLIEPSDVDINERFAGNYGYGN